MRWFSSIIHKTDTCLGGTSWRRRRCISARSFTEMMFDQETTPKMLMMMMMGRAAQRTSRQSVYKIITSPRTTIACLGAFPICRSLSSAPNAWWGGVWILNLIVLFSRDRKTLSTHQHVYMTQGILATSCRIAYEKLCVRAWWRGRSGNPEWSSPSIYIMI